MKRRSALIVVVAAAALVLAVAVPAAFAFQHTWFNFASFNVLATERALYDDVPAGINSSEAGLLLFINNQGLDETVGYATVHGLPVGQQYLFLEARAAVSDWGLFKVGYSLSPTASCIYPTPLWWTGAAMTNGTYFTRFTQVPAGVRKICILHSDNPDAVNIGKSSALIDYVRLRDAAGVAGWFEQFIGTP